LLCSQEVVLLKIFEPLLQWRQRKKRVVVSIFIISC
jgi:hypothetical protein